jgi:hypothetical protein
VGSPDLLNGPIRPLSEETGLLNRQQKRPKPELLLARRMVEELDAVEIIEDIKWDPLIEIWVLLCSLSPKLQSNDLVPLSTSWYVHIDDSYPWGNIKFFPAKINGLKGTFPHQNYNGEKNKEHPWSDGNLCLDTSYRKFKHIGLDNEPFDPDYRLLWHFERALIWLQEAAKGKLSNPGEPFELPDFNKSPLSTIVFCENNVSFLEWERSKKTYGLVELLLYQKEEPFVMLPTKFTTTEGGVVYQPAWGEAISNPKPESETFSGAWLILKEVPIIPPWQAPITWEELNAACKEQGIELLKIVKKIAPKLRDGKSHIFLIGFPIPARVKGNPKLIYWQPVLLPKLSHVTKNAHGFRDIETYNWFRDTKRVFRFNKQIHWLHSENWHEDELFNRGRLDRDTRALSMLQLGAGAVGSMISELLVRGGQKEITIMDNDILQAGNMVRHTLTLKETLRFKVDSLMERLNQVSPHSRIKGIRERFPSKVELIDPKDFDVILDCTGEDETMLYLSQYKFDHPKTFVSISLGYGAKRLFAFYSKGHEFEHSAFVRLMQPWLEKEQSNTSNINFPREGLGCWHPVFPARADDVWLMVSTAFKSIEQTIMTKVNKPILMVYEQQWDGDFFTGISLVSREEYNE